MGVGQEIGAHQPGRAHRAANVGLAVAAACGFSAFLFPLAVRRAWGQMFTSDQNILAPESAVLPIIGLCELGNCPQTDGCGILKGNARPTVGVDHQFQHILPHWATSCSDGRLQAEARISRTVAWALLQACSPGLVRWDHGVHGFPHELGGSGTESC